MSPEVYEALSKTLEYHLLRWKEELRDDLRQEVWVKLLETNRNGVVRWQTFDPDRGSLSSWTFAIVGDLVRRLGDEIIQGWSKDESIRETLLHEQEVGCGQAFVLNADVFVPDRLVRQAFEALSKADQHILELRREGESFPAIAQELGMSRSGARRRYQTAEGRMKKELRQLGIAQDMTAA